MNLLKKIFCLLLLCQFLVLENAAMALWFCACNKPQEEMMEMSGECCKASTDGSKEETNFPKEQTPVYGEPFTASAYTSSAEFCAPGCDPFKFQRFIYLAAEGKVPYKFFPAESIYSQTPTSDTVHWKISNYKNSTNAQKAANPPPLYLRNQAFLI